MDSTKNKKIDPRLNLAERLKINIEEKLMPPKVAWKQKNLKSDGFTTLGTLGNFSLVIGKAKSRKSFFMSIAASTAISNSIVHGTYKNELPKNKSDVLYFDTEQSRYHVQQALVRICKQSKIEKPQNLHVYAFRTLKPAKRLDYIEAAIYNNKKIGFVIIDGVRDLVTSINDEEQATNISSKLLKWTEELDIHIVLVLHQNKSDNNARGHLGTELINKSELVLSVSKENEAISIVKPEYCRGLEPEPFVFTIINGLPHAVECHIQKTGFNGSNKKLQGLKDEDKKKLLNEVFKEKDKLMYGKLIDQIQESYREIFKETVGRNNIVDFITESKNKGWINQEKPNSFYTLEKI